MIEKLHMHAILHPLSLKKNQVGHPEQERYASKSRYEVLRPYRALFVGEGETISLFPTTKGNFKITGVNLAVGSIGPAMDPTYWILNN